MTRLPQTPSFRLDGKRAVVTGASRGIGLAAAAALAEHGAEVTLVARSEADISAVADAINLAGGKADYATLDVTDITAVNQFFESSAPYSILINNAGTNRVGPMYEQSEEDYDAVIGLNVKSVFLVAQACAKRLISAGESGSFIHIGSQMGRVSAPGRSLYSTSKWAMEGMNKGFALDLAPHGIRSNVIAPTFIETPLTKPMFEDKEFLAKVLSKIKIGRVGQVEDLMGAVVFLASDASAIMTGSSLLLDGGWTAE